MHARSLARVPRCVTNVAGRPAAQCWRTVLGVTMVAAAKMGPEKFIDAAGTSGVDAVAALAEVRQAAADELITIWGKRPGQQVFEEVPPVFWVRHQIEWFGLLKNRATTEQTVSVADAGDRYEDLMTSRVQYRKWPPKRPK